MKKYIDHLHARPVHEKREVAVHAAAAVTGLIFLVWFSTLSIRFLQDSEPTTIADTSAASLVAATAAANQAFQTQMQAVQPAAAPGSSYGEDVSQSFDGTQEPAAAPATVIGAPGDPATAITP